MIINSLNYRLTKCFTWESIGYMKKIDFLQASWQINEMPGQRFFQLRGQTYQFFVVHFETSCSFSDCFKLNMKSMEALLDAIELCFLWMFNKWWIFIFENNPAFFRSYSPFFSIFFWFYKTHDYREKSVGKFVFVRHPIKLWWTTISYINHKKITIFPLNFHYHSKYNSHKTNQMDTHMPPLSISETKYEKKLFCEISNIHCKLVRMLIYNVPTWLTRLSYIISEKWGEIKWTRVSWIRQCEHNNIYGIPVLLPHCG